MKYDILIKNGHVIDPSEKLNKSRDVAIKDGKIAAVEKSIDPAEAAEVKDVQGAYVTPGLIDIHTHVYWGGTSLGVKAEDLHKRSGTTTFVDAGSSGAGNFRGFREHVAEVSSLNMLAFLNISFGGIFGFSKRVMVGEASFLKLMNIEEAVEVCEANRDMIVGIKARACQNAAGENGEHAIDLAVAAADMAGLPVMTHVGYPPPTIKTVIEKCRPGDIITHAFRDSPNAAVNQHGQVLPDLIEARKRGILLDIGHGMGGFGFRVAKRMAEKNIWPDMISSDVHILCVDGPAYDLLHTMSKFLCLGMPLDAIIKSVTATPATAMKKEDIGTLKIGSRADVTVLEIEEGNFSYRDGAGQTLDGSQRFTVKDVLVA